MKTVVLSAILLIPSHPSFAQSIVDGWIPLHTGNTWTYEHESRDDTGRGIANLEVRRWTTEETIIGSWIVPEGTLIGLRVHKRLSPPGPITIVEPDKAFLVQNDCLYTANVHWDPHQHQLTPSYRENLLAGRISPDFCFPLTAGKTWGAPHWTDWRPPSDANDWRVRQTSYDTFQVRSVSSYLGSGESAEIWFTKGEGIIMGEHIHHGTISEYRTHLRDFRAISQR